MGSEFLNHELQMQVQKGLQQNWSFSVQLDPWSWLYNTDHHHIRKISFATF